MDRTENYEIESGAVSNDTQLCLQETTLKRFEKLQFHTLLSPP